MKTVRHVLDNKGHEVQWISADASVFEAIQRMAENEIGSLLVRDAGKPVGLITERDYARKVILKGKSSKTTPVGDIMDDRVLVVHPEQDIEECMALMTERRVRHLPVIDDGQIVGIISIGDLVKAIIEDQRFTIEQLVRYISGEV